MSIQSILGNVTAEIGSGISQGLETLGNMMQSVVGTATAKIGSIYDGGFIGINENNWGTIKTAVEALIKAAEEDLNNFKEIDDREGALKGEAKDATGEYLKSCKDLLYAYISTYKNFITFAEESLTALHEGDTQNAQAIQAATSDIQATAANIRVD